LVSGPVLFVIEFKVGAEAFSRDDLNQREEIGLVPAWDYQAMARTQRERVEKGDSQIVLGDELTADYAVAEHARHKVGTLPRPERGEEIGGAVRSENRASVG
jgi:hypothetical protein